MVIDVRDMNIERYVELPLKNRWGRGENMQAFCIQPVTGNVYVTQGWPNNARTGAELTDQESTSIVKVSKEGKVLGEALVNLAGHGVGIGVEIIDGVDWIWLNWRKPDGATDQSRFKWREGFIEPNDPDVEKIGKKFTGGDVTAVLDNDYNNVALRIASSGKLNYHVRNKVDFLQGKDKLLGKAGPFITANPLDQGFASYGDVLYRWTGRPDGTDQSMLNAYDIKTGKLIYSYKPDKFKGTNSKPIEAGGVTVMHDRVYVGTTTGSGSKRRHFIDAFVPVVVTPPVKEVPPIEIPTEEEDMPLTDADIQKIVRAVWETDGILEAGKAAAEGNPEWKAESFLKDLVEQVRAQNVVLDQILKAVTKK